MGLRAPPGCGAAVAMNQVEYQATFWFPVPPPQIWAIIDRFDLFESWWAWLADFRADDGGLVTGNVLHGTAIPPVPYRLRLDVRLQQCDRPRLIEAAIDGDVRGQAALRLDARHGNRVPSPACITPNAAAHESQEPGIKN